LFPTHLGDDEVYGMSFKLPPYRHPDFNGPPFIDAPEVVFKRVEQSGVAPLNYHATSIYPEYFHVGKGAWHLLGETRMDCVVTREKDGSLMVREFRHLKPGDRVACGRKEDGSEGIFVNFDPFGAGGDHAQGFAFRTRITRETSFSIDYDHLYELLAHERKKGFIIWVLGPAVVFDRDARNAFVQLVERGYVHAVLAGNALAVHDVEASFFKTALGQNFYSKQAAPLGHYHHLDAINRIRSIGSIEKGVLAGSVNTGIMRSLIQKGIPYVLAGSIRDDGPLPEVTAHAYEAQDRMRTLARRATTVIALATQLHAIATGNMVPCYRVTGDNRVRPVFFYVVDMSEFAVNKLANRGSLSARSILTNVQDFVVTVERGLRRRSP
jgi:hypothetical protein